MKLTKSQSALFDHVMIVVNNVQQGIGPHHIYQLNKNGGVVVRCCRNGYATARKLIDLGLMVDATDIDSCNMAIKPSEARSLIVHPEVKK